jgi:exosortase/archaeosortase
MSEYMFSKIKDIKRKIYLAKIAGIIIWVLFIIMLGMTIFQQFQIADLKNTVEVLQSN